MSLFQGGSNDYGEKKKKKKNQTLLVDNNRFYSDGSIKIFW